MKLPELSKRPQRAERPSLATVRPTDLGLGAVAQEAGAWEAERRETQAIEEQVHQAEAEKAVEPILQGLTSRFESRFAEDSALWDGQTPGFARGVQSALDGELEGFGDGMPLTTAERAALERGTNQYRAAVGQRAVSFEGQKRGAVVAEQQAARESVEVGGVMAGYMTRLAEARAPIDQSYDGSQGDYEQQIVAAHDALATEIIDGAPPALKSRVTQQLATERLRLLGQAMDVSARGEAAFVAGRARSAGDQLTNAVLTAPASYENAIAQVDQIVAALPGAAQAGERARLNDQLTEAYVDGLIRDGQSEQALTLLTDGSLNARLQPATLARMLASAQRKSEELDVDDWMSRLAADDLKRDNLASIAATGQPIAGADPGALAGLLSPQEAARYALDIEAAKRVHASTPGFGQMTEAQIQQHLAGLVPEPGSAGFAEAQQRYQLASQAAEREIKARDEDPAAWALAQAPALGRTLTAIGQGDEQAQRRAAGAYAVQQLALQNAAGIPRAEQRIFTKGGAAEIVNRAEADPDPANGLRGLGSVIAAFEPPAGADGDTIRSAMARQRMVITELKAAGADNGDIAAAVDLSGDLVRMGRYVSATRGQALERLDNADKREVEAAADTVLAPYLRSFDGIGVSPSLTGGRRLLVQRLAAETMARRGGSARDAAREAADVVAGQYVFAGSQGWRMPRNLATRREDTGAREGWQTLTQRGAARTVATLKDNNGALLRIPDGQEARRYVDVIQNRGRWMTTPDDAGLVLMTPTLDGQWTPVLARGGAPVVRTWQSLRDAGRDRPTSAGRTGQGGGAPRGVRNNNPGNIEARAANRWQGQSGSDGRFATFSTPEHGLRALGVDLRTKAARGLDTVEEIIRVWAPPNENNTPAYVAAVSRALGVRAGDRLDLNDPRILSGLMGAIVQHENGQQPYAPELMQAAARRAIGR